MTYVCLSPSKMWERYPVTLENHSVYFHLSCIWQEGEARFNYLCGPSYLYPGILLPPKFYAYSLHYFFNRQSQRKSLAPLKDKTKQSAPLRGSRKPAGVSIVNLRISRKAKPPATLCFRAGLSESGWVNLGLPLANLFSLSLVSLFLKRKFKSRLKGSLARALHTSQPSDVAAKVALG